MTNRWLLQGTDKVIATGGYTDACARIPDDGMVLLFSQNAVSFSGGNESGVDGMGEVL